MPRIKELSERDQKELLRKSAPAFGRCVLAEKSSRLALTSAFPGQGIANMASKIASTAFTPFFQRLAETSKIIKETSKRVHLALCEIYHERTGNKLFAWKAIYLAADLGESPPSWAFEYLAEVAAALVSIQQPGKKFSQLLPKSIQINGHDCKAFHLMDEKINAYLAVKENLENGLSFGNATQDALDISKTHNIHVGTSTARNAYYELRDLEHIFNKDIASFIE